MNKQQHNKRLWIGNILVLVVSLAVLIGAGELVVRFFFEERLRSYKDERAILFRYDRNLGWFPLANTTKTVTGKQTITVAHNSRGFRDGEPRRTGRPGLMFLGDSFVWGYDVDAADRFTDKLSARMPGWDIYNLGVSGYGTDQELLLLMSQFDYYMPRIVFLVFCTLNDEMDNSTNVRYRGYYKPYFETDENGLVLKGVPVPKSLNYYSKEYPLLTKSYLVRLLIKAMAPAAVQVPHPTGFLIRKMNDFVNSKGSRLMVGLQTAHPVMESFLQDVKIPYIVLDAETSPQYSEHWTPSGHTIVSNHIYDFIKEYGGQ